MKTILSTLAMFAVATFSFAQTCTIDYSNNDPGTYPDNLPDGSKHEVYNQDLTLVFPQEDGGVNYTSFKLSSIELPLGLTWECLDESNGCTVDPQQDPFTCIHIMGTPAESGTFTVNISAVAMQGSIQSDYTFETQLEIGDSEASNALFTLTPAVICESGEVTFSLNNPINYTPISGQTNGVTHAWDFGNGNTSASETPSPQTYNTPGTHNVVYTQILDTTGFVLKKIILNNVGCDDTYGFGNPDIYIEIYDGSSNKVYSTESTPDDGDVPQTYNMNVVLNNPPYKINVMDDDEDNLWGTADDNCVNGDENDYLVGLSLPDVDQVGTTTQIGGANALNFTYDIQKEVIENSQTATVYVYENPETPIVSIDMNAPITVSTPDLGYVYHWNIDGERAYAYRGAEINPVEEGDFSVMAVDENGCYSISSEESVSTAGLSSEEFNAFTLFPNPTNGIVNIEFSDWINQAQITIVDISGRLALQENLNNVQAVQLDVSHLRNGIYSVVITNDKGLNTVKKLIVQ